LLYLDEIATEGQHVAFAEPDQDPELPVALDGLQHPARDAHRLARRLVCGAADIVVEGIARLHALGLQRRTPLAVGDGREQHTLEPLRDRLLQYPCRIARA